MKKTRLLTFSLAFSALAICLTGCGPSKTSDTKTTDGISKTDAKVYKLVLPEYKSLFDAAHNSVDNAERFTKFAEAEAYLLDQSVILPMNTEGGAYGMSRVLPYSGPYARYGSDSNKYKGYRIIKTSNNSLLPTERRNILKSNWKAAVARGWDEVNTKEKYNEEENALLQEWGYTEYWKEYRSIFTSAPNHLDYLASSHAQDSNVTTNLVDGLFEHDRFGDVVPSLAESYEVDETKKVYTVHLKEGLKWVNSAGVEQADLTADDFVAGMQHLLDAKGGSEDIVNSILVGAKAYSLKSTNDFSTVGVKALDKYTIQYTFLREIPYIESLFTFSIFLPLNRGFFESKGGVFGIDEFRKASAKKGYKYGTLDPTSILYCGAYRLTTLTLQSEMRYAKNPHYWDLDSITLDSLYFKYSADIDATLYFEQVKKGEYSGITLSDDTLQLAKDDGLEAYIYQQDTASGTFYGAFNLNRRAYSANGALASSKSETAKKLTKVALWNKNFRKAFIHAFNKAAWNEKVADTELKEANLRNMLSDPNFVTLPEAYGGYSARTPYGEIVQDKLNAILATNNAAHNWTDASGNPLNEKINVADSQDGYYDVAIAQKYMEIAKKEIVEDWADAFGGKEAIEKAFPVQIDVIYMKGNDQQVATIAAAMRDAFGKNAIQINAIEAADEASYLNSTYMAATGAEANYDFYYGSGWIPDYCDPATFLETMVPNGNGYMTKIIGLW